MEKYSLREGIILVKNNDGMFLIDLFNRKRLVLNNTAYSILVTIKKGEDIGNEYQEFCKMIEKKGFLTNSNMNKKIEAICEGLKL